jgi:PII-like signaling protein
MQQKVKTHTLGKLKIYIKPSERVKHATPTAWQKLFPKTAYIHIVEDARKEGILNASVYATQLGYTNKGKIAAFSAEGDHSKLTMCVELVDHRDKLEAFFLRHKEHLRGKVVIYKEVEYWDVE